MSEVSLDELRGRIEQRRFELEKLLLQLQDMQGDVKEARMDLNAATRDFNVAVAATKLKRKSPAKKKVDTGAAFHPTQQPESNPAQVDLEEAIAAEKDAMAAELDQPIEPVYRSPMVA